MRWNDTCLRCFKTIPASTAYCSCEGIPQTVSYQDGLQGHGTPATNPSTFMHRQAWNNAYVISFHTIHVHKSDYIPQFD